MEQEKKHSEVILQLHNKTLYYPANKVSQPF